ncbi:uncharacterized protein LOC124171832 [Ischnura elegans]|uniref:uncharacterized protein LOC124171832 n=1 Tax=Ischnura elegans TaxID=197161 RepID=UPI001ED8A06D|nr:uncharacterized protein LOC124171832 [Ischnura elegans]
MLKHLVRVIVALALFLPYVNASRYGNSAEKYAKFDTATNTDGLLKKNIFLMKMVKDEDFSTRLPPLKHGIEDVTASTADTKNIGKIGLTKTSERSDVESLDDESGNFGGNDEATIENSAFTVKNSKFVTRSIFYEKKEAHHKNSTQLKNGSEVEDSSPNAHSAEDRTEVKNASAGDKQEFENFGVSKTFNTSSTAESRDESGGTFGETDWADIENSTATEKSDYSVTWPALIKIGGKKTNNSHLMNNIKAKDFITRVDSLERAESMDAFTFGRKGNESVGVQKIFEKSLAESFDGESDSFNGEHLENFTATENPDDSLSVPKLAETEGKLEKKSDHVRKMKDEDSNSTLSSPGKSTADVNATGDGVMKKLEKILVEFLKENSSTFRGNNGQRKTKTNTTEKSNDLERGTASVWNEAQWMNNTELMSGIKVEDPSTGVVSAEDTTSAINSSDSENKKTDVKAPKSPKSDHNVRGTLRRNQYDHKKNITAKNGLGSWPKFAEVHGQPESMIIRKEKMSESSATVASDDNIYVTDIGNEEIKRVSTQMTPKNPLSVFINEYGKSLIGSERADKKNFTTKEKPDYFAIWPMINITELKIKNLSLPLGKIRIDDPSFDFPSLEKNAGSANASKIYSGIIEKVLMGRAAADQDKLKKPLKEGDSSMKNKTASVHTTEKNPKFGVLMEVIYAAIFALTVSVLVAIFSTLKKAISDKRRAKIQGAQEPINK